MAAEGSAEGTGRTVADPFGDFGNPDFFAAEQILRKGHAPRNQVFHRRQPYVSREPIEER